MLTTTSPITERQQIMRKVTFVSIILLLSATALAQDWSNWRGPNFNGSSVQTGLPVHFSKTEGIKWNVPSFCTSEYFATFNLRTKEGIGIILHLGAKVRDTATTGIAVADPESLLKWLAKDRASVIFSNLKDIDRKRVAFAQIIRQWIKHL